MHKLSIEKIVDNAKSAVFHEVHERDHWKTVPGICRDMFRLVSDRIKLVNNCR